MMTTTQNGYKKSSLGREKQTSSAHSELIFLTTQDHRPPLSLLVIIDSTMARIFLTGQISFPLMRITG